MKKHLIIFAIACGLVVGCQDEERDPLPFERQVELLAGKRSGSKTWILESLVVNGANTPIADCDTDNTITFYNNDLQEFSIRAGTEKCDSTEPDVLEQGSWMFSTDGKTIIISGHRIYKYKNMNYFGFVTSKPGKILELTETTFKSEINVVDGVTPDAANTIVSWVAN